MLLVDSSALGCKTEFCEFSTQEAAAFATLLISFPEIFPLFFGPPNTFLLQNLLSSSLLFPFTAPLEKSTGPNFHALSDRQKDCCWHRIGFLPTQQKQGLVFLVGGTWQSISSLFSDLPFRRKRRTCSLKPQTQNPITSFPL